MLRKYLPEIFLIFTVICNSVVRTKEANIKLLSDDSDNISLVNKALYDLINNYDKILKIFKSKEDTIRNDSVTLKSNDDPNVSSYEKQNETQKNRLLKKVDNIRASTFRPVTALIYESEWFDDDVIKKNKPKKSIGNSNNKNISLEYAKDDTDNDSSEYNESEDIQVIPIDMPAKIDSKGNKITIKNNKKSMKNKKPKVFQNILGEKTRFSIQRLSSRQTNKNYSNPQINFRAPLNIADNGRRIKRIVYSETFSPNNIWQEIISRPIKLNNNEDPFFKSQRPRREKNDKITIVILTKEEMDDKNTFEESAKQDVDEKLALSNEHKFKNREPILLRNTYGDTCLLVPIKKCNRAVKAVNKKVCKVRFKCKSDFKAKFIKNGKIGCKKHFAVSKRINDDKIKKSDEKVHPLHLRKYKYNDSSIGVTKDILPDNNYDFIIYSNNKTVVSITSPKSSLRDKYERECQKNSRMKCILACNDAATETCSENSCEKNKKKAFKKSCKEECKNIFIVNKGKDSDKDSSDSDNSDSSDSGSGS
ncbi:uncharacterized protein LOC126778483 [Nymphalis io]|uniref:uncharacterized protein LOC126778483 n=1 Tax=Inachis io TaxID=171585 RepID=UPI002168C49A|nr:uncharacterized protein LOC126778483 [Nymphalis io]